MSDILSRDPGRKPSRWTSPSALAVGGVAILSLVLILHAVHWSHPRHASAAAGPSGFAPPNPAPSVSVGISAVGIPPPIEPVRLAGVAGPSGNNVRLLLTGPRPGWFSPATRRFRVISGLPRWRPGYGFTRVLGGWAVHAVSSAAAACPNCEAPPTPVYFIADGRAKATKVGMGNAGSAAAAGGRLWLTTYRPGADPSTASGIAQEVTVTGHAVGPKLMLPRGQVIYRAIGADLLLMPVLQGPAQMAYDLWDPATGVVIREFVDVIASSPRQIVWDPCPDTCPLHVFSLSPGGTTTVALAPGTWPVGGTFSSDQRLLAVQVSAAIRPDGSAAATRLEVFNLANGHAAPVPGTLISSQLGINFGWAPGSDLLLAAVEPSPAVLNLASWQPGDTHMSIRTARLPTQTSLVLGDNG